MAYEFLNEEFLQAVEDIGRHGHEKYTAVCFHCTDQTRNCERKMDATIAGHAEEHFYQYLRGIPHDHFGTRKHQLAAVAFNAMMEFILADAEGSL